MNRQPHRITVVLAALSISLVCRAAAQQCSVTIATPASVGAKIQTRLTNITAEVARKQFYPVISEEILMGFWQDFMNCAITLNPQTAEPLARMYVQVAEAAQSGSSLSEDPAFPTPGARSAELQRRSVDHIARLVPPLAESSKLAPPVSAQDLTRLTNVPPLMGPQVSAQVEQAQTAVCVAAGRGPIQGAAAADIVAVTNMRNMLRLYLQGLLTERSALQNIVIGTYAAQRRATGTTPPPLNPAGCSQ